MNRLPLPSREQTLEQLLRWLPGVYRGRDADGHLRAYLSLFADELWRVRALAQQQYDDFFVDSAQDWVLPYIAELVGTDVLYSGSTVPWPDLSRRNRDDIKNTLRWRRQKGTLAGLQDIAQHVGGWGAHAVEMLERCAWLQNLNHIKAQAVFAIDLRNGEALARAATPFSTARRIADLRTPDQRMGWVRPRHLATFAWPIAARALRAVTPFALDGGGGGRFRFNPLGQDTALMSACEDESARRLVTTPIPAGDDRPGADIAHVNSSDLPIRTRDLAAHPAAYVGTELGFTIYEDGIALTGISAPASASLTPATDRIELAQNAGLIAADTSAYPAGAQLELAAMRLGAATQLVNGVLTPIAYNAGVAWAHQFALRSPAGRLQLDTVTPDFTYTPAVLAYEPDSGEFHRDYVLLALSNLGAAAVSVPEHEVIVRNRRGVALQVALPAVANLAAGATMHWYVADDGSSYYARADHLAGDPDRNPDDAVFGAFSAAHLARASEGQRRIRPGHPAGPARFWRVVARNLCCWDKPLHPPIKPGEIAVDPERGRFAFAAGDAPAGALTVDYHHGRSTEVGAGLTTRDLLTATMTVARHRDAQFDTLQAAINAAPNGGASPVVIEILDSAVYEEALTIDGRDFPGGLILQVAALQTPVLRKPAASAQLLRVNNTSAVAIKLSGLNLSGGNLLVGGAASAVQALHLDHCTLVPETVACHINVTHDISLALNASITGALNLTAPSATVQITDSIVQHPAVDVETPNAGAALAAANATVALERSTLLGSCSAQQGRVSGCLILGTLSLSDLTHSCLRYTRAAAPLPARAFQCSSAMPIFLSLRLADAGYAHLHPNTAAALLSGGEDASELGAYATAALPWRRSAQARRINEYLPATLTAVNVSVLPPLRFLGNRPS